MASESFSAEVENLYHRRFRVFAAERMEALQFETAPGGPWRQLSLHPISRSPWYEWVGADRLHLISVGSGRTVASIDMRNVPDGALLVLLPSANGMEGPRIEIVDDGALSGAGPRLVVMNRSGFRLEGTAGTRAVEIPAAGQLEIAGGEAMEVRLEIRVGSRRYEVLREHVPAGPGGILLLLPPLRRGSIEIQSRLLRNLSIGGSARAVGYLQQASGGNRFSRFHLVHDLEGLDREP